MQVAEERKADLARLYTLFARVQALDAMRVAFKEHIKKTGLSLVLDEEKARPPEPCAFMPPAGPGCRPRIAHFQHKVHSMNVRPCHTRQGSTQDDSRISFSVSGDVFHFGCARLSFEVFLPETGAFIMQVMRTRSCLCHLV